MDLVSKGYCQKPSRLLHQYLNTAIVHLIKICMWPDRYEMQHCVLSQHRGPHRHYHFLWLKWRS